MVELSWETRPQGQMCCRAPRLLPCTMKRLWVGFLVSFLLLLYTVGVFFWGGRGAFKLTFAINISLIMNQSIGT